MCSTHCVDIQRFPYFCWTTSKIQIEMNTRVFIQQTLFYLKSNDLDELELEKNIASIVQLGTWEDVRNGLLSVLYDNDQNLWPEALEMVYFLLNREFPFDEVETISLLYNCLSLSDTLDANLVWTITRTLKSLPYLSEYDPVTDPMIVKQMEHITNIRLNDSAGRT